MSKIIRTRKPSVLPFYAGALVFVVLCAVLPVYKLWALLVALGGAAAAFGLGQKFCPPHVVEHEVPFHTGQDDVDAMLTDIQQKLDTLHGLNAFLPDPALSAAMDRIEGAYSLVISSPTKLIAVRDPHGFRPLCMGHLKDGSVVFASESCALDTIGADMLFCSVYKFFGGHIGIAAIRKNVFEALDTYRLHPAPSTAPGKLETGTQSHEAIASIVPAVDFIAGLGTGSTRRERLVSGFERIERHENALAGIIRQGLTDVPGLKLYQSEGPKTATVAFTLEGQQPGDVCRKLCDRYGIFAADGDYYAETLAHRVGVDRIGGWIRVGFAPYNTEEEAELLVRAVREIAAG